MEELFGSTDLSETHDFLNRAYTTMQIAGHGPTTQTRIRRNWLKTVSFDDVAFSYALDYRAAPLDRVCICRVRSGSIFQRFAGIDDVLESGDIALPSWPDMLPVVEREDVGVIGGDDDGSMRTAPLGVGGFTRSSQHSQF